MNPLVIGTVFTPVGFAALGILLARNRSLQHITALIGVLFTLFCSIAVLVDNLQSGPQIYRLGGWPTPFGIVFAADSLSSLFAVMTTSVIVAGVIYVIGSKDKSSGYPAFMPLFLCMATGLNGALYTGDIFTLFVFIELMVISSVTLVAISDNRLGLEAAIKYIFISAFGTLFLLIGIGALYATFGTLTMADIARLLSTGERPLLAPAASVMLMCAFLLKSAIFPFHFWQPDFHTTAPTAVSAMLSSIVVKIGVYGLIRLTTLLFTAEAPLIQSLLTILGLVGIFFGGLGALRTYDAKRVLAYSTFSQIGFILVGIGWGSPLALMGAIVYAFNHAFIKSAMLMITGAVSSFTLAKTARLTELAGVGYRMTGANILYLIGGLALAGVPPLNGFISKLALVRGGIEVEGWVVLGLSVAAGIITLLYIIRTWQHIFQKSPDENLQLKPQGDSKLAPALLILICIILGLYASPLLDVASQVVSQINDPQIYINAVLGG